MLQLNDLQSSLFQLIGISQAVIQNSCKFPALRSMQLLFSFTLPAVRYFKNRIDDSVPRMILSKQGKRPLKKFNSPFCTKIIAEEEFFTFLTPSMMPPEDHLPRVLSDT